LRSGLSRVRHVRRQRATASSPLPIARRWPRAVSRAGRRGRRWRRRGPNVTAFRNRCTRAPPSKWSHVRPTIRAGRFVAPPHHTFGYASSSRLASGVAGRPRRWRYFDGGAL